MTLVRNSLSRVVETVLSVGLCPLVMSSSARTLASWFRIPLKAWMSLNVYSVFVLDSALATG
jgi:hypothetical protein